jgi:hypothetical protein
MRLIGRVTAFASRMTAALLAVACLGFWSGAAAQSPGVGVFASQEPADAKSTRLAVWLTQCEKFDVKAPTQSVQCTFKRPLTEVAKPGDFGAPSSVLVFSDPRVGRLCCVSDGRGGQYCWPCKEFLMKK